MQSKTYSQEYKFKPGKCLAETLETAFSQFHDRPCIGQVEDKSDGYQWLTYKEVCSERAMFLCSDLRKNTRFRCRA